MSRNDELYTWKIVYTDNSMLAEYDDTRLDGRGFAEVGEKPIRAITLATHSIVIPEGATAFFTRRKTLAANLAEGTQETSIKAHILGWKRGDEGTYLFIFEDGSTLLTNDLQAVYA